MSMEGLANVRSDKLTVVRRHWLFFQCLRGDGEDSERDETKFSAGVTVKFTAQTTMPAEERQPECCQRHSKCEQEDWAAVSQSTPYRTDWTCFELKRTPPDLPRRLFLYPVDCGRTNGAQWRQGESKFLPCFCSLNTTSSHRKFSMGYRRANSTQGNTNFQKRIFDKQLRDPLPECMRMYSRLHRTLNTNFPPPEKNCIQVCVCRW